MTDSGNDFHCSIRDRLLLHLYEFQRFRDAVEVPVHVTQEGISHAIHVHRKHIPRTMYRLMDKRWIISEKHHIAGKKQRLLSYFLTNDGLDQARALRAHYLCQKVTYKNARGETSIVPIDWIVKKHHANYTLAEILSHISRSSLFDISAQNHHNINENRIESIDKKTALHVYKNALEQAWKDGAISSDERELLMILRNTLNITDKQHLELETKIIETGFDTVNPRLKQLYITALKEALKDKKITKDERAILENIRFFLKESESNSSKKT